MKEQSSSSLFSCKIELKKLRIGIMYSKRLQWNIKMSSRILFKTKKRYVKSLCLAVADIQSFSAHFKARHGKINAGSHCASGSESCLVNLSSYIMRTKGTGTIFKAMLSLSLFYLITKQSWMRRNVSANVIKCTYENALYITNRQDISWTPRDQSSL